MPKIYTPFLFKHEYSVFREEWPNSDLPETFEEWIVLHTARCKRLREEGKSPEPLTVSFDAFRLKMNRLGMKDPGCAELESYAIDMGESGERHS